MLSLRTAWAWWFRKRDAVLCYDDLDARRNARGQKMSLKILGIESSCDETAAAVVADGREILSSVVASQIDIHRKYGGVVPELASREHLRQIVPVVREALAQAGLPLSNVDAIGVTQGPGLVGALLVGITYGKTLAQALGKPLVPVNHLEGHVHAVFLEAYDKVAKLLGLGYPGGPILDRLAAISNGAPAPVKFGQTKTRGNALDFSFSGLKTAVLYHVRETSEYSEEIRTREEALQRGERKFEQLLLLCSPRTLALVREFQNAVVRDLVERTMKAAEELAVESVLVSGGVAANSQLRATFEERAKAAGVEVFFPSRALSTDNAAMIAAAAYSRLRAGILADTSLNADPSLALT